MRRVAPQLEFPLLFAIFALFIFAFYIPSLLHRKPPRDGEMGGVVRNAINNSKINQLPILSKQGAVIYRFYLLLPFFFWRFLQNDARLIFAMLALSLPLSY